MNVNFFRVLNRRNQTQPQSLFILNANGVTVEYTGNTPGETGYINDDPSTYPVEYTAVDNTMLNAMDPDNDDYTDVCTTLVTDMSSLFEFAGTFNQDISHWDTSNVTNMAEMFLGAFEFNQDLSNWNVSNVTNMSQMFWVAKSFNQNINSWDVSNVTNMSQMFFDFITNAPYDNPSNFNQPLNSWNVSSVTNMGDMFGGAIAFNQPLNNWDVSSVTNMAGMFLFASAFNQDISNWCVTNIPTEPTAFDDNTSANWTADEKPCWGYCGCSFNLNDITFNIETEVTSYMNGSSTSTQTSPWVDESGNRLYLIDYPNKTINQLSLSIPNDITSIISPVGTSPTLSDNFTTLHMSDDGGKVYLIMTGSLSDGNIKQYNLTTAWDISTMSSSVNATLSFPTNDYNSGFCFSKNGLNVYGVYVNSGNTYIARWSLSTAWDISTNSSPTISDITSIISSPSGIFLIVDAGFEHIVITSTSNSAIFKGGINLTNLHDDQVVTLDDISTSDNNDFIYGLWRRGKSPKFQWSLRQYHTNI